MPQIPAEVTLAQAAASCLVAAEQAPCAHCGNLYAEQWGNAPWHCFQCKQPLDAAVRTAPEDAAKAAAVAVDAPFVDAAGSGGLTPEGEARHGARGVRVRFLKELLASVPAAERRTVTTGALVALLIKPATRRRRCRFVELWAMRQHTGAPRAFVSHVWSAPFADLVAAIAHAISDDECVWVDILCAALGGLEPSGLNGRVCSVLTLLWRPAPLPSRAQRRAPVGGECRRPRFCVRHPCGARLPARRNALA